MTHSWGGLRSGSFYRLLVRFLRGTSKGFALLCSYFAHDEGIADHCAEYSNHPQRQSDAINLGKDGPDTITIETGSFAIDGQRGRWEGYDSYDGNGESKKPRESIKEVDSLQLFGLFKGVDNGKQALQTNHGEGKYLH